MKKSVQSTILAGVILYFAQGCSKSSEGEKIQQKKAAELKQQLYGWRYRLTNFYSDSPIDYIEGDNVVRSETDLRQYIKPYLVDDINVFDSTGKLSIIQNSIKIPGNDSALLKRNFLITWDDKNVYLDFVDYNYVPLRYTVDQYSNQEFTIYLHWHTGARIFSVFTKID